MEADREQIKLLHNKGIIAVNVPSTFTSEKTVIVLGAPRGGTSMVAGSLHLLGVHMGDRVTEATYEDSAMLEAITNRSLDRILKFMVERNIRHQQWGWKQPKDIDYFFDEVLPRLRNPVLITIYRDVLSIGNRNLLSAGLDVLGNMLASLSLYQNMTKRIIKTTFPLLLVSYEKVIQRPDTFVMGLAEFLNIDDPQAIAKAIAFIEPNPKEYLKKSYLLNKGSQGRLDNARVDLVTGWAFLRNSKVTVAVDLFVNDDLITTTEAHKLRKDLLDKGLHHSGNCGFVFRLNGKCRLKHGDSVRVRIHGETKDLANCPLFINDLGSDLLVSLRQD